jgi:hypothetical protein
MFDQGDTQLINSLAVMVLTQIGFIWLEWRSLACIRMLVTMRLVSMYRAKKLHYSAKKADCRAKLLRNDEESKVFLHRIEKVAPRSYSNSR